MARGGTRCPRHRRPRIPDHDYGAAVAAVLFFAAHIAALIAHLSAPDGATLAATLLTAGVVLLMPLTVRPTRGGRDDT